MTDARRVTCGAPEGEDYVRFVIRVYNENDWMVQVHPLGAYAISRRWTALFYGEVDYGREWFNSHVPLLLLKRRAQRRVSARLRIRKVYGHLSTAWQAATDNSTPLIPTS